VRAYVGLTPEDSALLASFATKVEPHLDTIIDDFYERILADAVAKKAITGGTRQVERLKKSLRLWLDRTLKGPHDEEFAALQFQIGFTHVRVNLDQAYMVTGINVFREHLNRLLFKEYPQRTPKSVATQRAFTRVLDLTLALMLDTYREAFHRKLMESEQNATFRRLAALGEVAASIAHEIRNPLAGISGAIQVLSSETRPDDPRREILSEVLQEIVRLDERINDLLLYARPSPLEREFVKPDDLLKRTVLVLGEDPMFKKAKVTTRAAKGLPSFPLDSGQIQQVLVNLVLNSLQSMNGSGEIRLTARQAEGGALEMTVEDDGPGVRADIADEVFKPFFTTRRTGTGLGLPISRKIVEMHGGTLELDRAAKGARFVIRLPLPPEGLHPHPPVR
jgi:signal transduction histidine kinase